MKMYIKNDIYLEKFENMTTEESFRACGKDLIDYVTDYMKTVRERPVKSTVEPDYLRALIPKSMPDHPDEWKDILNDVERVIMPGITHWRHPNFHAYYASLSSYPSTLGDILSGAIACVGFNWISSPACTELEMVMMDWIAELIGLPQHFLFSTKSGGGGCIHSSACESTLVSMISARIEQVKKHNDDKCVIGRLVAYTSAQAHSSVTKGAHLAGVQIRQIETDEKFSLRGEALANAIKKDKKNNLIPFHCTATLGTTNTCAFDNLKEIGEICKEEGIWLHIDAAYAGSAFACKEYRHYLDGIDFADSFNFNLHKWMLVNFDCSAMYLKDNSRVVDAFRIDPLYMQHNHMNKVVDYRHWQIPMSRRFRSLKIWFVMRMYGKTGVQRQIRDHIKLAKEFESFIHEDGIFEIVAPVVLGLVCFRIPGMNKYTEELHRKIIEGGKLFLVPAMVNDKFVIRFALVNANTTMEDVKFAYDVIKDYALDIIRQKPKNGTIIRDIERDI